MTYRRNCRPIASLRSLLHFVEELHYREPRMNYVSRWRLLVAAGLCLLAMSGSAYADFLIGGQSLMAGQVLAGNNGAYYAAMQTDGNFVVYRNDGSGRAIWSTNTTGLGAVRATMQEDGNFVLYRASGQPVWDTASNGPGRYFTVDNAGRALVMASAFRWSTRTGDPNIPLTAPVIIQAGTNFVRDQVYTNNGNSLVYQQDGNLVLYRNGSPVWNSATNGSQNAFFGGNIIVYRPGGAVMWSTQLAQPKGWSNEFSLGPNGSYLSLESNGNLSIVTSGRIWGSPGDFGPAPGGDGPICVGNPLACVPWTIPYTWHF